MIQFRVECFDFDLYDYEVGCREGGCIGSCVTVSSLVFTWQFKHMDVKCYPALFLPINRSLLIFRHFSFCEYKPHLWCKLADKRRYLWHSGKYVILVSKNMNSHFWSIYAISWRVYTQKFLFCFIFSDEFSACGNVTTSSTYSKKKRVTSWA